ERVVAPRAAEARRVGAVGHGVEVADLDGLERVADVDDAQPGLVVRLVHQVVADVQVVVAGLGGAEELAGELRVVQVLEVPDERTRALDGSLELADHVVLEKEAVGYREPSLIRVADGGVALWRDS